MLNPTAKLDAVNAMLMAIGEAPVASLTGTLTFETGLAVTTLDEVSRDVQSVGWAFNTDRDYTFSRNLTTGIINVPLQALKVEINPDLYPDTRPVYRQGMLYNTVAHNNTFLYDVTAKRLVWGVDYESLPELARKYIKLKATRLFAARVLQTPVAEADRDELMAWVELKDAEGLDEKPSLRWSPGVISTVARLPWVC